MNIQTPVWVTGTAPYRRTIPNFHTPTQFEYLILSLPIYSHLMACTINKTIRRECHHLMTENNFSTHKPDLGTHTSYGTDRSTIDKQFSSNNTLPAPTCIVCTSTAHYKLVPKHSQNNTAEILDRGYVCEHCLKQQYFKPEEYGIRELPTHRHTGGNLL